jgi:glycosyltransferase involved in cell wall biosynthesis
MISDWFLKALLINMIGLENLLRILWFNWRDIRHPDAGGAEVFTHEIMRRLVEKYHFDMTLFAAEIPSGASHDKIDGINIVRGGNKYTVYDKAKTYYNKHSSDYDFIVDESNTKPFLTPRFVKNKPILAIFHQLSREGWFYETPFPLNYLGYYYFEKKWLSYYKKIPTATVSNSTKEDLQAYGFKNIFMVPEGLSVTPISEVCIQQKETNPTIAFIGRLKKHKLPNHALEAFSLIKKELPNAKMWVIGNGYMLKELKKRFSGKDVIFYGHVENNVKNDLLAKAHLVLVPAVREGWGLVVTESNAMGTPAIGYNVPGLKDSIRDGETGILVKENSPYNLAKSAISLLRDRDLLDKFSSNALAFSKQFSWENSANAFAKIIQTIASRIEV